RTQDAGHAFLRQTRNPKVRKKSGVILILSKFSQNEHAIASHANHGIVFLDTDAMVTRVYAERYLPADENAKLQADIRYGD
uniref:hypothetical protein n=1 Tax=Bifidobacterium pseudocatenulatum TaxID=28026 RepID=UPI0034A38457